MNGSSGCTRTDSTIWLGLGTCYTLGAAQDFRGTYTGSCSSFSSAGQSKIITLLEDVLQQGPNSSGDMPDAAGAPNAPASESEAPASGSDEL